MLRGKELNDMNAYVTGSAIRALREKKGYTQKDLADRLCVSDKAVSKWETQKGLPDVTLLEPLAAALGVSLAELLSGACVTNRNRAGSMLRSRWYVCPVCGNVIHALGEGSFSCCGVALPPLEAEEADETHSLAAVRTEDEWFVSLSHPMEREHYISFLAYVTDDRLQLVKLYPEQAAEARFTRCGSGLIYAFCNRHGLFRIKV
jgi:desulfoferrodoxin (superoxide reductase-like protein)/DNA-binding XRE family transcriptional regulator